jgi:hypothetical protein
MSDIVWAINPKRESVVDLIRRMRQPRRGSVDVQ